MKILCYYIVSCLLILTTLRAQTVTTYATGMPYPFSLVFNPGQDTLYVSGQGSGVIYRVVGGVTGTLESGNNGGYGIVRDNANTTLYTGTRHGMLEVNIGTATNTTIVSSEFNSPWGLAIDQSNSNLYVADGRNNRIMKVALPGGTVSTFVDSGGSNPLNLPYAVILNAAGTKMYIANTAANNILEVTVPGGVVSNRIPATAPTPINYPTGIVLNSDESYMYVTTYGGDIYRVRMSDDSVKLFVSHSDIPNSGASLVHIITDSNGNLYTPDFNHSCIYKITTTATGINDHGTFTSTGFELAQNFPNPFNPTTTITYNLPVVSNVLLTVYNTLGQQVATLVNERQHIGTHEAIFQANGLPSGVYLYRLQTNDEVQAKTMILTR